MRAPKGGRWSIGRVKRRAEYVRYMDSSAWFIRREHFAAHEQAMTGSQPVCAVCGKTWAEGLDLHHVDYARLGDERHEDLVALCRDHHDQVHKIYDQHRGWRRMGLRGASAAIIARLRRQLIDGATPP